MTLLLLACYFPNSNPKHHDDTAGTLESGSTDSGSNTTGSTSESPVKVSQQSATTGRDGTAQFTIHVAEDNTLLQIDAERTEGGDISTEYFYDAKGNTLFDWQEWAKSKESLTDALYADGVVTVLAWPARSNEGFLKAGDYVVSVATTDSKGNYEGGVDVEATFYQRVEPNIKDGALKVVVAYAEGVDGDPEVVDAVEKSLDRWKEIYKSYGINLSWRIDNIPVDASLPDTDPGEEGYKTFTEGLTERELVLVVGRRIAKDLATYGEAGGIPGPLVPSNRSAVAIGWEACAGADGTFSEGDIEVMAETMAHEVGHYLGAYHPVESNYKFWDALDDTPKCTSMKECDSSMGDNLMYAYTICDKNNNCDVQDQLTTEQQWVFQSYMAVE